MTKPFRHDLLPDDKLEYREMVIIVNGKTVFWLNYETDRMMFRCNWCGLVHNELSKTRYSSTIHGWHNENLSASLICPSCHVEYTLHSCQVRYITGGIWNTKAERMKNDKP